LVDCDGVRLLPGPAGHVQRLSGPVGHRRDLVGATSATVFTLTLVLVAVAIYRLPLPDPNLVMAQGMKVVAGGMMGAFIVAGLAFVAPRLGPTQTFILYFFAIAAVSALIDSFGLLGTEAKPLHARQLVGVLLAGVGLALARS
jgi:transporter family-2 protein